MNSQEEAAVVVDTVKKAGVKWLQQLASTITAAGIIGTVGWWLLAPRIDPILNLPDKVLNLDKDIERLNEDILLVKEEFSTRARPEFIKFRGNGVIHDQNNREMFIIYALKREVSCDTEIQIRYWDVDKGFFRNAEVRPTIKAPITKDYALFKIPIKVSNNIPPGTYIYQPILTPLDCGIYKAVVPPMSGIFTITE